MFGRGFFFNCLFDVFLPSLNLPSFLSSFFLPSFISFSHPFFFRIFLRFFLLFLLPFFFHSFFPFFPFFLSSLSTSYIVINSPPSLLLPLSLFLSPCPSFPPPPLSLCSYIVKSLQQGGTDFTPVCVGRSVLQSMNRHEVFIKKWPPPLKYNYYKSIMPDVSITLCSSCNRVCYVITNKWNR